MLRSLIELQPLARFDGNEWNRSVISFCEIDYMNVVRNAGSNVREGYVGSSKQKRRRSINEDWK